STFMRDADGTYFSYRIAPIDGADTASSATEFYPYAPLGAAAPNALPVPSFDSFGAWEDWISPDGRAVPLRDANGKEIVDAFGVTQNLKAYSYEWRYVYQRAPIVDDRAHERERSADAFSAQTIMKAAKQTVAAWTSNGLFAGVAMRTIYAER